MKNLSQINENKDIITKEYLEEEGNAATSKAFIMQDIPEGSDLNDFLTPGFYGTRTTTIAGTILNSPLKTAFSLLVMYSYNSNTTNSRIVQIINNYSDTQPKTYMRNIYAGSFGEWEKIILKSDLNEALTGYLPLTGGIVDGSFINITDSYQYSDFRHVASTSGGLAKSIFRFYATREDAENNSNPLSVIGHLSSATTPQYIYLAVLDPESDKNPWDQSQGLVIGKTFLRWKGADIITKNIVASQTSNGLMSASDKTKLDGIATMTGATTSAAGKTGLVPAPAAGSATRYLRSDGTWQVPPNTTYKLSSFGITATAAELNKLDGATVTTTEINYLDGVESNIQNQLDKKFNTSGGTLTGELIPSAGISHVGKDKYIAYPDGGQFTSTSSSVTGYCKIILPVSWTSTMLKFKISIFNYATGESTDYIVAGYNYAGNNGYWTNCTAYCLGKPGATHSNLPVIFGHNGTKCLIAIGTTTTTWAYPQATISDLFVCHKNDSLNTIIIFLPTLVLESNSKRLNSCFKTDFNSAV